MLRPPGTAPIPSGRYQHARNNPARGALQGMGCSLPCQPAAFFFFGGGGHILTPLIPPYRPPNRIKHPNIVALDDIYESSSHLYLIMQL